MRVAPRWVTAFLDLPAGGHDAVADFWSAMTGYARSAPRGDNGEFGSLLPPDGDPHLKTQRLDDGDRRVHLDLHVDDPVAAAGEAAALGARVVHESEHGYVVLRSPGGVVHCLVDHAASRRAAPATWPGGHRSVVDQVCLDAPPSLVGAETAYWADLTGWELRESRTVPGFRSLRGPAGQPVRLLLQRLDDEQPEVTGHLDLAADDRAAEVARHVALGAVVVDVRDWWTVLRDPGGAAYCVTDRDPGTGEVQE